MPNTNTTFFLFNPQDSLCWPEEQTATNKEPICTSSVPPQTVLPVIRLHNNPHIAGNLLFTIAFLIIFAFIRLRGKDLFTNLLNLLLQRKKVETLLNEGISSNLICYILSLCLSFSVLSVCITFLTWNTFFTLHTLYIFGGMFVYHFFLLLTIRLIGWTFNSKPIADEFIVNVWAYHILSGILIAPFVIALFFVKFYAVLPLLKIIIIGLSILIILKIIRWLEILFLHRVLILYMILYLCTLEFIPLLILYKLVVD